MAKKKSGGVGQIVPERLVDWSGGQNNAVNVALLNDNESRMLQNYSLDEKGTLFPFPGSLKRYASDLGSSPVAGMGKLYKSDGTSKFLIGLEDGKLYVDSPHLVNQYDTQAEFNGGSNFGVQADSGGKLWPMIIKDGFESGLFDDWHTHDSGWTIDSTVYKTGAKSAKGTGTTQKLIREFGKNTDQFYVKMAVRFAETNQLHYPVILISPTNTEIQAVVAGTDGHFKYHSGAALTNFPTDKTYAANTWYVVEVWVRGGTFWVSIDGTDLTPSGLTMKDTANTAQVQASKLQIQNAGATSATTYVDDVEINLIPSPTFTRASVAYKEDGSQVASGVPRYEAGQAVLLEEGTTNQLLYSEQLDQWATNGSISITPNAITAPNGQLTADKVMAGASGQNYTYKTATVPAGSTITVSVYVKKGNTQYVAIGSSRTANWYRAIFDLDAGVLTWKDSIVTDTSITAIGNGWYRLTAKFTIPAAATSPDLFVGPTISSSMSSNSGDYVYVWGGQLEVKGYSTSYMATTTAVATRVYDSLSIPSSVFNKGNWTIEIVFMPKSKQNVGYNTLFGLKTADGLEWYEIATKSNGVLYLSIRANGVSYTINDSTSTIFQPGNTYHVVVTGDDTTAKIYINGVNVASGNYAEVIGALNSVAYIGANRGGAIEFANGLIDDLRISNIARTDQEIADAYASGQPLPVDADTTYKMSLDGNLDVSVTHHWFSPAIDCSNATDQSSGHAALTTITPGASNVTVYSRSAPTNTGPWTGWVAALGDGSLQHAADDYIEVKLILARDGENDPYVDKLTVSFDGQATATLLASDFSAGKQFFFDQLNDLLAVMTGDAPRKYDGTTLAAMGGDPPHAPYGVAHKNRFWMALGSRLYFSDLLNIESWPVLNFIDIMPNDGDEITGMITFGDYLVIAKGHSVWLLIGETISTFRVRRIHSDRGCYAPRSLCIVNQMLCFVSDDGIYFSDFTQPVLISERIRKTWDGLNKRRLNLVASWFFDHKLYVAVPDAGQQRNNRVIVYDSLRQAFAGDRIWPVSCWTDFREAGEINSFFGRSDLGNVRKINTGYNDDGASYEAIYESLAISHGAGEILKRYNVGYLQVKPAALDAELIISFIVDGVETSTMTVTVPANATGLIDTLQIFASEVGVVSGHRIQIKIKQSVLDNPIGIQSVYLEALPLLIAPTLRG